MTMLSTLRCVGLAGLLAMLSDPVSAQKKYDPGATDASIKIGNIVPYSGPASAFGTAGKAIAAYFAMVNEKGGINGRKIEFISYDDGYSPPRSVEQVRKLVESDEVLFVMMPLGTPPNSAIQRYLNGKKVPQLFAASGATRWGDPKGFPWTIGWQPTYQSEARIYAKYILDNHPGQKISILYQNDDFGKDYAKGLRDGLGDKAGLLVKEAPYEVTDPSIDSQILQLKAADAGVLFTVATPKFAAQAIRKMAEIGWRPVHFLTNTAASVAGTLKPAGLENAMGLLSTAFAKDPTDPQWENDPARIAWAGFMEKYYPAGDRTDYYNAFGTNVAQAVVQVLKQCKDELTRENVMRQAANLRDVEIDMLLPGVKVNTSSTDFYPLEQLRMMRFDGTKWELFGPLLDGSVAP